MRGSDAGKGIVQAIVEALVLLFFIGVFGLLISMFVSTNGGW